VRLEWHRYRMGLAIMWRLWSTYLSSAPSHVESRSRATPIGNACCHPGDSVQWSAVFLRMCFLSRHHLSSLAAPCTRTPPLAPPPPPPPPLL
jgi:hypothetical protein